MEKIKLAMHLHSNLSDGELSVENIISKIKSDTIDAFSICDHNIFMDEKDFISLKNEKKFIPGIEITCNEFYNFHILGYGYGNIQALKYFLKINNEKKHELFVKFLNDCLIKSIIDDASFNFLANKSNLSIADIYHYFINKKMAKDYKNAYDVFVGKLNHHILSSSIFTFDETIKVLKMCGFLPVLAHPFSIKDFLNNKFLSEKQLINLVDKLKKSGLYGIEILNAKYDQDNTKTLSQIAKRFYLKKFVGCDFHAKDNIFALELEENLESFIEQFKTNKTPTHKIINFINSLANEKIKIEANIYSRGTQLESGLGGYIAVARQFNKQFIIPIGESYIFHAVTKESLIIKNELTYEQIALARFQLISALFFKKHKFKKNIFVLVLGCGCVGFALLNELKRLNFENISLYSLNIEKIKTDIYYKTLKDIDNKINFDLIFETTGNPLLIKNVFKYANAKTSFVIFSTPRTKPKIDLLSVNRKNLTIYGSHELNGYTHQLRQRTFDEISKYIFLNKIENKNCEMQQDLSSYKNSNEIYNIILK